MRLVAPAITLLVYLLAASSAQAASQVVRQKASGLDRMLSISADDGSAGHTMTLICEPKEGDQGVMLEGPGLSASGVRVSADSAPVTLPAAITDGEPTSMFLLPGEAGRQPMIQLISARVVDVSAGSTRLRFVLGDVADDIARFRQDCGL